MIPVAHCSYAGAQVHILDAVEVVLVRVREPGDRAEEGDDDGEGARAAQRAATDGWSTSLCNEVSSGGEGGARGRDAPG